MILLLHLGAASGCIIPAGSQIGFIARGTFSFRPSCGKDRCNRANARRLGHDLLQNASLRLLCALEDIKPETVRDFFGLAALQIRRELIDLTRHYYGPQGQGANHHSDGLNPQKAHGECPPEETESQAELERWTAFHEAVEQLPTEEREIVGLVFYHGWTQAEIAELCQISERTCAPSLANGVRNVTEPTGRSISLSLSTSVAVTVAPQGRRDVSESHSWLHF